MPFPQLKAVNSQFDILFQKFSNYKMYEEHLYKQQLYNSLANDHNLVDNVKLQLRQKIISKLKNTQTQKIVQPDQELVKKVSASLFMNYLNSQRLFHTLAVFSPQSGFSKNIFNEQELKSLFRIGSLFDKGSILQSVLMTVMPRGRITQKTVQSSCQTDDKQTIQNLQNKLSHIEFQYKQKAAQGLKTVQDSQVRFLKYKNQINKRYKDELDAQIRRIRDFQIANIRLQEQEKYTLKIRDYEQQLQLAYRSKMQKLRQREADVVQRVAQKMKQVQTYNYQSRQRMLKDFQSIKARQQQIQKMKSLLQEKQRHLIREKQTLT